MIYGTRKIERRKNELALQGAQWLLVFCLFVLQIPLFSQAVNSENSDLTKILEGLEDQYQIHFSYDHDRLSKIVAKKQHENSGSLSECLDQILTPLNLGFETRNQGRILIFSYDSPERQGTRVIHGEILDGESGLPVEFATIQSSESRGDQANDGGNYEMQISAGTDTLIIRQIGYQEKRIAISEETNFYRVTMTKANQQLGIVEVQTDQPDIINDIDQANIQLESRFLTQGLTPIGNADPLRSLQLLPGILANNDLSSEIKIRGGQAGQSLIILDGMPLYESSHYYGIFSNVNAQVVDQIRVYKNQSPVEIQSRTSGFVDIKTLPGSLKKEQWAKLDLGFLQLAGSTMLSSEKVSLTLSGRTSVGNPGQSTFQSLLNPFAGLTERSENNRVSIISQPPDYSFYDLNGKLMWSPSSSHTLTFATFHSHDQTLFNLSRSLKINPTTEEFVLLEKYDESGNWNNHAGALNWVYNQNDRNRIETKFSLSTVDAVTEVMSLTQRRVERDSLISFTYENSIQYELKDFEFQSQFIRDVNPSGQLQIGLHYQHLTNQYGIVFGDNSQVEDDKRGRILTLFGGYRFSYNDKFVLDAGTRISSNLEYSDQTYIAPQINLSYEVSMGTHLKASASSPVQFVQRPYYEDQYGRSYSFWSVADRQRFPVARSYKGMFGFQKIFQSFKIDVDGYLRKTDGIIEVAPTLLGIDQFIAGSNQNIKLRLFQGQEMTKGIDFMISMEKRFFNSFLAYTISETTQSFPTIFSGQSFPSKDDMRHQFKWSNAVSIGNFSVQANYFFNSGRPFTDISKIKEGLKNREDLSKIDRISFLPDYHRIDLGLNYELKKEDYLLDFGISILNLTNRQNVRYSQSVYRIKDISGGQMNQLAGTEWGLLGRTLNLQVGLQF